MSTLDSFLGARALNEDAIWSPVDGQLEAGISWQSPFLLGRKTGNLLLDSALFWDLGARFSYDSATVPGPGEGDRLRSRTWDLSGGFLLRPGLDDLLVEPYIGAGVALVITDIERSGPGFPIDEHDALVGSYFRTGLRMPLDERRHVGLDARWLFGVDEPVDGIGAGANAMSLTFLMGVRF